MASASTVMLRARGARLGAVLLVAGCSIEPVTFTPLGPAAEDCAAAGDEDGNGAADCGDAACAGAPACQGAACTPERCDGLDNDCSGAVDDAEAVGAGSACAAASCAAIRAANPAAGDGRWWIAPVAGAAFEAYCDMTGGGWTLVMNQVPGADLPDRQDTVNAAALGSLDRSYRLGNPLIAAIRPTSAWKLTDEVNQVFFAPACVVDWSINYLGMPPSPCTVGYTTEDRTVVVNGGHQNVSTRGIGINNGGTHCSIRAYNTLTPSSFEAGPAATCLYRRDRIVRLWYR